MELTEARERFIQMWGTLGSSWGINRTMAQIHALLLVAHESMSTDQIKNELQISTGNANMNIRALIDWGLVHKELRTGQRKEFFVAEKDMGQIVKRIIAERKKRELDPVLKVLDEVSTVKNDGSPAAAEFHHMINDIRAFSMRTNSSLEKLIRSDTDWLMNTFMKLIR